MQLGTILVSMVISWTAWIDGTFSVPTTIGSLILLHLFDTLSFKFPYSRNLAHSLALKLEDWTVYSRYDGIFRGAKSRGSSPLNLRFLIYGEKAQNPLLSLPALVELSFSLGELVSLSGTTRGLSPSQLRRGGGHEGPQEGPRVRGGF